MTWSGSESLVAQLVGGCVTTDKAMQYADIDVLGPDGVTYSVKRQAKALQTGNISLELALFNEAGEAFPGNWAKCQADALAIVLPADRVLLFNASKLNKRLLEMPQWDVRRLTDMLVERNREAGRKMVDALNLIVPLGKVVDLAYRVEALTND